MTGENTMIQSILGQAVPHDVAAQITPQFIGAVCTAVTKGVFAAQAEKSAGATMCPKQIKARALKVATNDYDFLCLTTGAGPQAKAYAVTVLAPALVDGLVQGFNLAMLFDTSKPVQIGGQGAEPQGVAYTNGAQPKFPVPEPGSPAGPSAPSGDTIESGPEDDQSGCIRI